jgi:alanine racemase
MTHLACGEDFQKEDSFSKTQLKKFEQAVLRLKKTKNLVAHIFNTTGLLSYNQKPIQSELAMGARPGIGLYGYAPDVTNNRVKLSPVLSLYSQIVHIRKLRKGESVSYGRSWCAKRDSIIGIVPVGYADGLPKALSNRGRVIVKGQFAPIVGNVTMDNIMIDLTDLEEAKSREDLFGSKVTLIGETHEGLSITVSEWANLSETIEWEILTRLSERVPRKFIGGSHNEKKNN